MRCVVKVKVTERLQLPENPPNPTLRHGYRKDKCRWETQSRVKLLFLLPPNATPRLLAGRPQKKAPNLRYRNLTTFRMIASRVVLFWVTIRRVAAVRRARRERRFRSSHGERSLATRRCEALFPHLLLGLQ